MDALRSKRQRGATMVHWLFAIVPLMGFGALAIDMNNVYNSVGELQNAADAGALEGARLLYQSDGTIRTTIGAEDSTDEAWKIARANLTDGAITEVVSVRRGHWEFKTAETDALGIERGGTFTANSRTTATPLIDADGNFKTSLSLNSDTNAATQDIKAVEVITARETTRIQALFGRLLGIDSYRARARSVAYIGFAGSVDPQTFDFPIAMCQQILTEGCDVARLVPEPDQTGGWTNLVAHNDGSCGGATPASELTDLVANSGACGGGGLNVDDIYLGTEIQVNNGQVNSAFTDFYNCWLSNAADNDLDGWPDESMILTLPVVEGCQFGGDCGTVIGAVRVEVMWMFLNTPGTSGSNSIHNTAPRRMAVSNPDGTINTWNAPTDASGNPVADGIERWDSFVNHFGLLMDSSGTVAEYGVGGAIQKTLYLKPDCDPTLLGNSGGPNYGIRAEIPALVY